MPQPTAKEIGERIKALRQKDGVAPEDLAPSIGVSAAVLNQIEKGSMPPTVAVLLRISQYFGVSMDHFLHAGGPSQSVEVIRGEERERIRRERPGPATDSRYTYLALAPNFQAKHMQPLLVEFELEGAENVPQVQHKGEEFLFILEGEVELHIEDEVIALKAGDSVYYKSELRHAFRARGTVKPKAVAVVYSGSP